MSHNHILHVGRTAHKCSYAPYAFVDLAAKPRHLWNSVLTSSSFFLFFILMCETVPLSTHHFVCIASARNQGFNSYELLPGPVIEVFLHSVKYYCDKMCLGETKWDSLQELGL